MSKYLLTPNSKRPRRYLAIVQDSFGFTFLSIDDLTDRELFNLRNRLTELIEQVDEKIETMIS